MQNLLGVPLRSLQIVYFFHLTEDLIRHIEDPDAENVLPVKLANEEVVVEAGETEVKDSTYVGESRSVITR